MANKYYQESKDWLRKKASEKYRNLSEKKKKKKKTWKNFRGRYQNFSEKKKEKSVNIIAKITKIFLKNKSKR